MDFRQVYEELLEISLEKDLTKEEISYIIVVACKLLGEIEIRENKIRNIAKYCKTYKPVDYNNHLRDVEELCLH